VYDEAPGFRPWPPCGASAFNSFAFSFNLRCYNKGPAGVNKAALVACVCSSALAALSPQLIIW